MRIALAQLDSRLDDLAGNEQRARESVEQARAAGADLVVFAELQLSGYARGGPVVHDTATTVEAAAGVAGDMSSLIGFHERDGDRRYNSAVYVEGGEPLHVQRKLYLVDYPPWNEDAYFAAGDSLRAFDTAHGRAGVLICNDAWQPFLPSLVVQDGAEILLMPSASSTVMPDVERYWQELTRFYARMLQCYVVFVNRVGTEGEFRFWGGSHVVDPYGDVLAEAPRFEESLLVVDVELDRVAVRRRELPLAGPLRPELLRAVSRRASGSG